MRDKRKTLDKKIDNVKLNKVVKKQKLQEQGITLIALVVTIIILLILAGVTLNIALSDNGLFGKAKKATEEYKQEQENEEESIRQIATQMYSEYVGAEVTGYELNEDNKSCTIEIKINNGTSTTFTRDDQTNWRIWDFDGNILRIIGDPTSEGLTLTGAEGYNNGVWAIDHICKELYSNNKSGVSATNLKKTDIQKVSKYDYTKYEFKVGETQDGSDDSIHFGETKTYSNGNTKYPSMWEENDKNWTYEYDKGTTKGRDKECKTWEVIGTCSGMKDGNASTEFKDSYYGHSYKQNEFTNDKYYDLIFKKADGNEAGSYWLACRYVELHRDYCEFGFQRINASDGATSLFGTYVYWSDRYTE